MSEDLGVLIAEFDEMLEAHREFLKENPRETWQEGGSPVYDEPPLTNPSTHCSFPEESPPKHLVRGKAYKP